MLKVIKLLAFVLVLGFLWPFSIFAQIPTTEWINFYSSSTKFNDSPVSIGTTIEAFAPGGILCGQSIVRVTGSYGLLACYLDDPNTSQVEGIKPGDKVSFRLNGINAGSFKVPKTVQNGDRFQVDLSTSLSSSTSRPVQIPEPITILLFGTGLVGLARLIQRRYK